MLVIIIKKKEGLIMPRKPKNIAKLILIKKYAFAAVNLYGVIELNDFVDVYNHYETDPLTSKEAVTVLELLASIDGISMSFKQNILTNSLFYLDGRSEIEKAKDLLKIQSTKPKYLPLKDEFLKYEDDEYIEPMDCLMALYHFIKENKLVKIKPTYDIWYDIMVLHDQYMFDNQITYFMDYIEQRGYVFSNETKKQVFTDLLLDIQNNTRMYTNNGYTPNELKKLLEKTN